MKLDDLPLIQRKQARIRLGLLDTTKKLLKEKALADITVEELCREVEISGPTFFRHFPRKVDLIYFHLRLWTIESTWQAKQMARDTSGLPYFQALFHWLAVSIEEHPRLFAEMTAIRSFEPEKFYAQTFLTDNAITLAERLIRYPHIPNVEQIPDGTFFWVFKQGIDQAIENDDLPEDTDMNTAILSLATLFWGVPLCTSDGVLGKGPDLGYKEQLPIIWLGLQGRSESQI